jgi:hypothetical protein
MAAGMLSGAGTLTRLIRAPDGNGVRRKGAAVDTPAHVGGVDVEGQFVQRTRTPLSR